ncbi:hypothetical protein J437_LFUL014799 [Ladona fulva]|uniref:Uncharacterized protein n=1 Tax=Ladona fulva TaxID=123851 RepID=A0A8K0KFQ9_LADFU|nr:hypothetical protein J437_LFUL014799 [Ladona fulva]
MAAYVTGFQGFLIFHSFGGIAFSFFKVSLEMKTDFVLNHIFKLVDYCTGFQGFLSSISCGGIPISGFRSLLMERLAIDCRNQSKLDFTIYRGPRVDYGRSKVRNLSSKTMLIDITPLERKLWISL